MAEHRFQGRPASPGLVIGPLHCFDTPSATTVTSTGTVAEEHAKLDEALTRARAELDELIVRVGDDGGEVLAFQSEMLDDPALVEDARAAIDTGAAAARAWHDGIDAQIAGFREADDDYFRARASDLEDLQDRVGRGLRGDEPDRAPVPEDAILTGRDLTPSRFLATDWSRLGGIALREGSAQSHVAMLARARGVPMVVGLGSLPTGDTAVLDAGEGLVVADPDATTLQAYGVRREALARVEARAAALLDAPATLATGERVHCLLNIDDPAAVDDHLLDAADGVGLWRTEFLFFDRPDRPGEDEQCDAYVRLLDRLGGHPVTIRTLDIGGDKPLAGLALPVEANPFLGLRGVRLCLEKPELFRPQIRALLRAAPGRALKVMLPMVTRAAELDEVRDLFRARLDELLASGVDAAMPPLGMMVETPAAAVAIDTFAADFVSIGSNDLVQYTMAAARDAGGRVAALADPLDPAVLRLIEGVIRHGHATGIEVSLCGDMAADPDAAGRLLGLGLRRLSVGPAALARLKLVVAEHDG